MNDTQLLPDDPRITAYALGELEGDERAAVEQALRQNPALRMTVDEIRATAAQLEAALADETVDGAERATQELLKAAIIPGRDYRRHDGGPWQKLGQFPQLYFVMGGLAAACFALVATLRTPPPAPVPHETATAKTYIDMNALLPGREVGAPTPPPVTSTAPVASAGGEEKSVTTSVATGATIVSGAVQLAQSPASAPSGPAMAPTLSLLPNPELASSGATTVAREGKPAATVTLAAAGPEVAQSRVLTFPADDKFVVEVSPKTTVTVPEARKLAANSDRGSIVNESRGLKGSSLAEITQGTEFAGSGATEPTPATRSGELMFLSPFTVSAERFAGRATGGVGAAGGVSNMKAFTPPAEASAPANRPRAPFGAEFVKTGNTESYSFNPDNGFVPVAQNAFSTFSVDTDTASYANIRRMLLAHQRPPRDAVRIDELLNYFPYRYAPPAAKSEAPFAASLEVADAPWAPAHRLVRIGLKGREVSTAERPAANLVFLLDVSGSMNAPNRLPLVKESMRLLIGKLRADDRVAIVTYAGQSGLALPSTPVSRASEILAALDSLAPGGSTNGSMGIQLAYDIAKANRVEGGINRVILCTDGDFNVGVTSEGDLVRLIQDKAQSGVFLTVLGYGMGNLKDSTLEKLADKGNGNYGYIDSRREAEKLLVQQVSGTLVTIAKDVKLQVEFNPSQVASYRLIGYENRLLKKEDFADDKVDAGEIGAGHTVTALYEVIPVSVAAKEGPKESEVEERRYTFLGGVTDNATLPGRVDPRSKEMLLVKVRYKKPDGNSSARVDFPLVDSGARFAAASPDFKFAAAVAGFGMILRESPHKGTATMASVAEWAEAGAAEDPGGYRSEFIELARNAEWVEQR